jgi:antitoxin (DNA-binding transcriptional repressor) of toxin-antitoxin stability system
MKRAGRAYTPMSARDLKNSTGEVVRTLRRGGSILLTFRGKPLGTIEPLRSEDKDPPTAVPFEEAWAQVEAELERSEPRFASWRQAEDASRGRR